MFWKILITKPFNIGVKKAILLSGVFLWAINLPAQENKRVNRMFDQARQQFTVQEYDASVSIIRDILKRDSAFVNAYLLLADIYQATGSTEQEIVQLKKAASLTNMPQILYRLGLACYKTGEYQEAIDNLNRYRNTGSTGDARLKETDRILENCYFALDAIKKPVEFHPNILPDEVNSEGDEYWPGLTIDQQKLVFTRLIKSDGSMPQEDFFITEFDSSGWGKAQPIVDINTPENEGAQSVSADGNLLFFTACNRRSGMGSCDIYYSIRQDNKWSAPRNIGAPVNSRHWEAQPSISSDGRWLYFSGDRPGGEGKKDIWRAEFDGFDSSGKLKWKPPVNLGPEINTQGDETSPFIHPNNTNFYFASNYHTGMGGFDMFMSLVENDTLYSEPSNLGYPINTFNDEQGLFFSADGLTAFFSSRRNRETGLDIWSFDVPSEIRPSPVTYAKARIVDAVTKQPVRAMIRLSKLNDPDERERIELAGHDGEILMALPSGADYIFSVSMTDYLFYTQSFGLREPRNIYNPYNLLIELQPIEVGSELNLYNVYFETDSFRILQESEPELQTLVQFLQDNPGLTVEIQGHTDSTGPDENNLVLSERRAQSVVEYLTGHEIKKHRLSSSGYGETKPVSTNDTEEGRRMNRRVTLKIVSAAN